MKNIQNMGNELLTRYAGNTDQIYSITRMLFDEGKARGSAVYDVRTGGGLEYQVLADSGLDIGRLTYRGINISYLGKPGITSPYCFHPFEADFVNTFPGGMLYTCGLLNTGESNRYNGEWQPEHGRYHSISADHLCARIVHSDNTIELRGRVTETQLFAHNLEMQRTIKSPVGRATIIVHDELFNNSPEPSDYMLLYHCNLGYPFLSPALTLSPPEHIKLTPKDAYAEAGLNTCCEFSAPVDGYIEQVFFYDVESKDALATVRAENTGLGIGMSITWTADNLPTMVEWKSMLSTDYVLGLEPSTNHVIGRSNAHDTNTLKSLPPFSRTVMEVTFEFYDL